MPSGIKRTSTTKRTPGKKRAKGGAKKKSISALLGVTGKQSKLLQSQVSLAICHYHLMVAQENLQSFAQSLTRPFAGAGLAKPPK